MVFLSVLPSKSSKHWRMTVMVRSQASQTPVHFSKITVAKRACHYLSDGDLVVIAAQVVKRYVA